MIEIDLLPGDGKKKRRGGTGSGLKFEPAAFFAQITDKITDKYLLSAVGAGALSALLIGFMFVHQAAASAALDERENKAVGDSARLSAVLVATARAEAARDSLFQQIAVIKSIDDTRYTWSHLMYEISNALPQYTWLTSIVQTSAPRSAAASDTVTKAVSNDTTKKKLTAAEKARARSAHSDSLIAATKEIKFQLFGQTVDIQALTRFMKALEASPFIQNVQLTKSAIVLAEGKEVTQFLLEAETQAPPAFVIKTVPLLTSPSQ
jgi:Tfp pilus assembly protein PilN